MFKKLQIWLFIEFYKSEFGYHNISNKVFFMQVMHETNFLRSEVFNQNNNLFGMRLPKKRPTLATGENLKHATFKSLKDSVKDYFMRQENFGISKANDMAYIKSTIESNYAEDKNYFDKWVAHVDNFTNNPLDYLL